MFQSAWLRAYYHKSVAEASLYLGGVDPGVFAFVVSILNNME